jgi:AcrR family transcriptional regulator
VTFPPSPADGVGERVGVVVGKPTAKGARTRDAILQLAVEHACRVGLAGLTIGDLATAAGMSKSGMYAHFGSKEAMQVAVLDAAATEFADAVVVPALAAPRGEPRLRTLVDLWLRCGRVRGPGGCVIVKASTELDEQPGPVRARLRELHLALDDSIARIVAGGVREGHFRPDLDGRQFAFDLYAVMLGFHHAYRLLDDPQAEARARRSVESLLDAARSVPPAGPDAAPPATRPAAPPAATEETR